MKRFTLNLTNSFFQGIQFFVKKNSKLYPSGHSFQK